LFAKGAFVNSAVKQITVILIFILLISAIGAGCSRVTVKVPVLRPAEVNLAGKNRVAVGRILGPSGEMVSSYIRDYLSRSDHIELVTPQVGGTLEAPVLIEGEITEYSYRENIEQEYDTCVRRVRGKNGIYDEEYDCIRYQRVGRAKVSASFRVLEADTGRLITPKSASCEETERTQTTRRQPPSIDSRAMLLTCSRNVAWELTKTISPHTELVPVVFYRDKALPWLEKGIARAEKGQWEYALTEFREAVRMAELDRKMEADVAAKAYWNLGLALAYSGKFDEAEQQLQKACSLDKKLDCDRAVTDLLRLRRDRERLSEQTGG
jgi:tetratricopeptide (TPR) repeat protein